MSLSFLADQEIARRETAFIQRHVKHRVTARAHMMLNDSTCLRIDSTP